ncbi:MAG: sodium:proton antiporter, partial [Desulfobacterales bacterium]
MAHESVVIGMVIAIFGLLLVAAVSAIGLKKARLPYSVGLVIIGLGLETLSTRIDALSLLNHVTLSPDVIMFVFLPTLIFESAFSLDSRLLSKNMVPILVLAAPGLLISTALIGALVAMLTPLPIGPALLFGALISATDPVAVVALFRELGTPKRLTILVEGESLFNDATAIVLFGIILAVLDSGIIGVATIGNGLIDFLVVFGGGLLVGGITGWLMVSSIALADNDPLVQVSLSTVVAYAAFIAAEHYLHVSGVMATVGAGIIVSAFGTPRFTPHIRAYLHQFWEYAAFVANGLIFLMVGLSIKLSDLFEYGLPIILTILTVLAVRAIITFTLLPAIGRLPGSDPVGWRYRIVLWWGGLRGAVALALAFSLAHDFPYRDLVISLSVGVVLFTLLTGGFSMKRLIHILGLDRPSLAEQIGSAQLSAVAKREAMESISRMADAGHFSSKLIADMQEEYQSSAKAIGERLAALQAECSFHDMKKVIWLEALTIEKTAYRDLQDRGEISEPVLRELELATELQRDVLARDEFPTSLPSATPLELQFTGWAIGLLEHVSPTNTWVHRYRLRSLAAQYQQDMARLEASKRIASDISQMRALFGDQKASADVMQIYEQRGKDAMDRIDSVGESFPEYVRAVQLQAARRTALEAEADAVTRLASTGG